MFDAAQAVPCASSGPRVPSSIDIQPAGRLGSVCPIQKGLTRAGPLFAAWSTVCSNDATPPSALPTANTCAFAERFFVQRRVGLGLSRRGHDKVRTPIHPVRGLPIDVLADNLTSLR